jgi:excisionase family DNA binding protein
MSEVLSHTIAEAMKVTGLGRSSLYEAIAAGKISAVKAGKRTLIPASSLRDFIADLPAADIGAAGRKAAA